jgi:salicylate hydroxylase
VLPLFTSFYGNTGFKYQVEDAAVLGVLFSHLSSDDQMIPLLRGYQRLRYDRTAQTQRDALANHSIFRLDDGPKQEERNRSMRAAMEVAFTQEQDEMDGNANIWADKKKSQSQFSYDAEVEAEQWYISNGLVSSESSFKL